MSQCGVHVNVRGFVQGVGFRYYCYRVASDLGLTGWVRNLPDSSVEIEAEGERGLIEQFIKELKVGPRHASVTDVAPSWLDYTGQYQSFDIRG